MTIFRSTGPVISTRRSWRSAGSGATSQAVPRMWPVSAGKLGRQPASHFSCRAARAASSSSMRQAKRRTRSATKASASVVRTRSAPSGKGPWSATPGGGRGARPRGVVLAMVDLT